MSRRPNRVSAAAIGGAIALLAVSAAPAFAQDAMPAGGYTSYPVSGEVDCEAGSFNGNPYTGLLKSIEATDDYTVVFNLCNPDGAFLKKVAFSVFAIQDADYLAENVANGVIRKEPNGTGPYRLSEWREGQEVILEAFDGYWGEAPLTPTVIMRWSSEPGQKLIELESGNTDAIDNPSVDDEASILANESLEFLPRDPLNVFYIGMNNKFEPFTNEKIRQGMAQGIDRQKIVDTFYRDGSKVADWFTPCEIPFACEGEAWWAFDPEAGKAAIAEGLAELGLEEFPEIPISLRIVDRTYLPFPEQVGVEIQNQLQENLGISSFIDVQESGTFIANAYSDNLPGLHLLGWNADYPEVTNFLDFHFGTGSGGQFGELIPEITSALTAGATTLDEAERAAAYADANNAIREFVPMIPVGIGASATAWAAGIEGAHSSPLGNEEFRVIDTGDDDFVWTQNGEPISMYCADESDGETFRACEQIFESLYGYEVGGVLEYPRLAEECVPNEDFTSFTCTLKQGIKFHNGADLTAHDVVTTYAHIWDRQNPMHAPLSSQYYYQSLWGGFLNADSDS